jgi:hypothetical protein
MRPDVIKEQVSIKGLSVYLERNLAADESETPAKFQQEVTEMGEQTAFQLSLLGASGQRQKIELIRVLENLLG